MSNIFKIRKGLDIKLLGEAEKTIKEIPTKVCAIKPPDFHGVFPKLLVQEGDEVKAGTPLFFNKYRDNIIFTSPVSGKVREIRRGAKRVVLEVSVEAAPEQEFVDFGIADPNSLDRAAVVEKMLKSGVWPILRQRPYSIIANPDDDPKAIMISAFDSAPLAPGFAFIAKEEEKALQAGIDALKKLTSGKVHMNISEKQSTSVFSKVTGVELNTFSGPHPAGNVSTQINRISPLNKGETVWYLRPQDVLSIGRLFLGGKLDPSRIIALTGSEVGKPQYYKTVLGAAIDEMINGNIKDGKNRYISGNVLTGTKIEKTGFVGFYDSQVSVIPEGDHYEFLGWGMPGLKKFSFYYTFFSWMTPRKKYRLDTNYNGGERAFILTGKFEQVFPLDIYPMQLVKSIMIEDIDAMENLGIYEVDEEDFALCEFISTSKINLQKTVRDGIDLMIKEMN
ncbi:MAG: NADH:ubiquinone reductase (Na(+)-transporting) subunit A [Bacteroidetes bacterium]|nr:MAG: NADH:ubiquinone reductase (Na(+)-transporting) subunit A [Bacteroidota bacterium]RLD80983.1 MAG: NADH:ubiquinone reductase (Na(+)-transporting) subunit A [Bacteroidota bacterium]